MHNHRAYHWIQRVIRDFKLRLGLVVIAMAIFALVFPTVYRAAGPPAGALVTVLVLISSFLLGIEGGLLIWALSVPMFILLVSYEAALENWPGIIGTLFLTVVVGAVKNFIFDIWHQHQAHVTVTDERLTKINNCFLSFDADPPKNIKRLTSLTGELLGSDYAVYYRYENGRYDAVGFARKKEIECGAIAPECVPGEGIFDQNSDDVVIRRGLQDARYRDALPCVPMPRLHIYAGKSVRTSQEYTGTLCVMYEHDARIGTAEKEIFGILASAVAVEEKRMRFEKASRESELSYIDLFNTVTEAIYILDAGLTFVNVNQGALNMYGHTREELIGKTPAFVSADGRNDMEHIAGLLMNVYANGEPVSFDFWGKRKNGDTFPKRVSCSKGKYFGRDVIIATARDLTDQKMMQEQLMQSQKLESLGTLTGGIAHDFNNLLAMVLGSAELLQTQMSGQPQLKKYIDRIIEASERGTSISRQLLIFSRPDQVELKPVALSQIISQLRDMLSHFLPKSIVIETAIDDDGQMITGDAGQIHQALLNLALNARDAMESTGTLTITQSTAAPEFMAKKFPLATPRTFAVVSVSDTGTGMSESIIARIFDPFFSTKDRGKGTGLGLAMVHGIVKNHGGFIDVVSVPNEGTTFSLYFPKLMHTGDLLVEQSPAVLQKHSETILLVDDEEHIREMLVEFLSGFGYGILAASNGMEALEVYRMHHGSIDLVITDLGMPEMGGEELYRQLKGIDPGVKVMVSSGYLDGTTKEHLLRMGIRDVLTKPSKLKDMQEAIRRVLQNT